MKFRPLAAFVPALLLAAVACSAADLGSKETAANTSFRHEIQRSIDRGLDWLIQNQNSNGWWATADHPAVTALALHAFTGDPSRRIRKETSPVLQRGYKFVLSNVQTNGAIFRIGLANYNTAISMLPLLSSEDTTYKPVLQHARQWLIANQIDMGEKGIVDTPFDGGIGYGSKYDHSDMNNTLVALEALYLSRQLDKDAPANSANDLNWTAVRHFIQSCQNLPGVNTEPWVAGDEKNKGGFIYYPGNSMAGSETNTDGKIALRSYGSISYAGLLSYIYADVRSDDPKVTAVMTWLKSNFSLEENPGMGAQGYFYYLHLMSKALNAAGIDQIELKDGRKISWRREVAMRLMNLQKPDGAWLNDQQARWWEKETPLVTAYSILALEIIHRGL
jgi:squalene-hopene/tetraprenyl-beta-curcumene cyclase